MDQRHPVRYEIHIRGILSDTLLTAFGGLGARRQRGETILFGVLPDQAALHGVLAQIEALGLELLEVRRVPTRSASEMSDRHAPTQTPQRAGEPR